MTMSRSTMTAMTIMFAKALSSAGSVVTPTTGVTDGSEGYTMPLWPTPESVVVGTSV